MRRACAPLAQRCQTRRRVRTRSLQLRSSMRLRLLHCRTQRWRRQRRSKTGPTTCWQRGMPPCCAHAPGAHTCSSIHRRRVPRPWCPLCRCVSKTSAVCMCGCSTALVQVAPMHHSKGGDVRSTAAYIVTACRSDRSPPTRPTRRRHRQWHRMRSLRQC